MVAAVAGMVDPVRLTEITAAVSRTHMTRGCSASEKEEDSRGNMSQAPYEVCEFVTARSGASQPAAFHLL